jgi:hypothetical protein
MFGLRQLIRSGRSSRFLALWIAYSLAIEALMASVGLGMSAFATPGPDGFVICSHASGGRRTSTDDRRHNRNPVLLCPFCLVAAQSAGHFPLLSGTPAFPVSAGFLGARVAHRVGEESFVPQLRCIVGTPRAPPPFSA